MNASSTDPSLINSIFRFCGIQECPFQLVFLVKDFAEVYDLHRKSRYLREVQVSDQLI